PSAPSRVVGLAKAPQRAYLDRSGATAWDISPVGSRGNLDLMQYALICFDVQLILAQMPWRPPAPSVSTSRQRGRAARRDRPRPARWGGARRRSVAQLAEMARP